MKSLTFALLATAMAFSVTAGAPVHAGQLGFEQGLSKFDGITMPADNSIVEKRSKPRIKGGSGCDDPNDVIEHPECR